MSAGPNEMQLVAMALGALPAPPMPMLAGQQVPDEITTTSGEHKICNTHDLMGMLLVSVMSKTAQPGEHEARKERQQAATTALFDYFDNIDTDGSNKNLNEIVYNAFAKFTREYINALSSKDNTNILSLGSVRREDRIHIASCHHTVSQDVLFGNLKTDAEGMMKKTAREYSEFPYTSLMMRQFMRIRESRRNASVEGVSQND